MGTHPIFESDFDCLTECKRNRDKMDRKDSKKQRLSQRVKSVNHESVPVTPVLSEHNHNFDSDCSMTNMDGELAGNALLNFRSTLTSLDLQFTNICTELNRVNRENLDLKRQVERLEDLLDKENPARADLN